MSLMPCGQSAFLDLLNQGREMSNHVANAAWLSLRSHRSSQMSASEVPVANIVDS